MSGSSPLLQAARLWERTSARGTRYMAGRLGGVRVVILPNRDYVEGDQVTGHTHTLFFHPFGGSGSSEPKVRFSLETGLGCEARRTAFDPLRTCT
jgi:hypothetical protein